MDREMFKSLCWQGNVNKVIDYLNTLESNDIEIVQLKKKLNERFISQTECYVIDSDDPWIKKVVECYLVYFREVLTENNKEIAEKKLIQSLLSCLNKKDKYNLDEIESGLESIFKEKGYEFMGGITKPYRGPYIWKTTKKKDFKVSLPSGIQNVTVYFISDFLMLSWAHYASFGMSYSGGWCKEEGLYYVNVGCEEIDTESVDFQVWFLKHEAQHLSDYQKYPNLNSVNLEYRAKLIELIYNPSPEKVVDKYIKQAKKDISLPHSYAAYTIINALAQLIFNEEYIEVTEPWKEVKPSVIKNFATSLFNENEKQLQIAGCKTEGVSFK